jgi:hypothetical protein
VVLGADEQRGLVAIDSVVLGRDFDGEGAGDGGGVPVPAVTMKGFPSADHQQSGAVADLSEKLLL